MTKSRASLTVAVLGITIALASALGCSAPRSGSHAPIVLDAQVVPSASIPDLNAVQNELMANPLVTSVEFGPSRETSHAMDITEQVQDPTVPHRFEITLRQGAGDSQAEAFADTLAGEALFRRVVVGASSGGDAWTRAVPATP